MKFLCKNENYYSQKGLQGVFKNPYVRTVETLINTEIKKLKVSFSLQYIQNEQIRTLEGDALSFNNLHTPTIIENDEGKAVEIIEYLNKGGTYNENKVISWGQPSFDIVQGYFDLDSAWTDLKFKESPFKQLAIDYVLNTVKIEGLLLKEYFPILKENEE